MPFLRRYHLSIYVALLILCLSCGNSDDNPPSDVVDVLDEIALDRVTNFVYQQPVLVTFASPQSAEWMFVVERRGVIHAIIDENTERVFLDLQDRVNSNGFEQGLLGLSFHPQFGSNGLFYVYYTNSQGNSVISRFNFGNGTADPGSEFMIMEVEQPRANHNAGTLEFGPDGFLYIALGDGGGAGDPFNTGQDRTSLLGSILRIDVDNTSANLNYTIPIDNPFAGNTEDFREEIFAYGLRNPFRFSFDRQTGNLYAGDVGQNAIEEIDLITSGGNYGWNTMEGSQCFGSSDCDMTGLTLPIAEYNHDIGQSVTGGFVHRSSTQSALNGLYFFADFVSGTIFTLDVDSPDLEQRTVESTVFQISSFGQNAAGKIFFTDFDSGAIYTIR